MGTNIYGDFQTCMSIPLRVQMLENFDSLNRQ